MFSDLYYLSILIDENITFSDEEKILIFKFAQENPSEILKLIKIFEEDIKGLNFIKNFYKKSLGKLKRSLINDLLKTKRKYLNQQIKYLENAIS